MKRQNITHKDKSLGSAEFNRRANFIEQAMIIIAKSNFTMVYNHLNTRILATLSLLYVHTEHGICILDYCFFLTYKNLPKLYLTSEEGGGSESVIFSTMLARYLARSASKHRHLLLWNGCSHSVNLFETNTQGYADFFFK